MIVVRNLARAFLLVSILFLANLNLHAQQPEYPDELKSKFTRQPVVTQKQSVPKVNRQLKNEPRKGFFKSYGKGFLLSSAVYWAGTGLDLASSQGDNFREGNSLFRNSRGGTATGKNLLASGGIYAGTVLLEKYKPQVASVMRFAIGAARMIVAARNWKRY